jgi:hypothetical protein
VDAESPTAPELAFQSEFSIAPAAAPDEQEVYLARFDPRLTDDSTIEEYLRIRLWLAFDQLNNPLIAGLGLTPAEKEVFKNAVLENLLAATDGAAGRIEQGSDAVKAQIENALAGQQPNLDARLQRLFGAARFTAYLAYREDYGQLNRIKFLKPDEPLSDAQAEQIVLVMADERQRVNSAAAQLQVEEGDTHSPVSPGELQQLINERVKARLAGMLPADHFAAFVETWPP